MEGHGVGGKLPFHLVPLHPGSQVGKWLATASGLRLPVLSPCSAGTHLWDPVVLLEGVPGPLRGFPAAPGPPLYGVYLAQRPKGLPLNPGVQLAPPALF